MNVMFIYRYTHKSGIFYCFGCIYTSLAAACPHCELGMVAADYLYCTQQLYMRDLRAWPCMQSNIKIKSLFIYFVPSLSCVYVCVCVSVRPKCLGHVCHVSGSERLATEWTEISCKSLQMMFVQWWIAMWCGCGAHGLPKSSQAKPNCLPQSCP